MSPALPAVSGRMVVKALASIGFVHVSTSGSHVKVAHPDGRTAVVPMHGGRDIPRLLEIDEKYPSYGGMRSRLTS